MHLHIHLVPFSARELSSSGPKLLVYSCKKKIKKKKNKSTELDSHAVKQEIFHTQFSCIIMQIGSWFGHIQTIFAKCNTFWVSYLIDYEQKIPLSYERSYHNH